ncbi:MAG: hypothetical protein EA421_03130 [Gemmatimonadales bacterium]|nr:MAG: hypothetical protein EA421_03130 [Gemmatimonadales bacterium]
MTEGSGVRRVLVALSVLCVLAFGPGLPGLAAQDVPPEPSGLVGDAAVADPAQEGPITPGGAFARSLVLPGWGHLAVGAPTRGAFYITAQAATGWMLWKSASRRRTALRFRRTELRSVEEEIRRRGILDPDSVRFLAEGNERVERWDELVERREDQVEDWAALGLFLVFLGATDAFVSAHLADFPEPLSLEVFPRMGGGGWEVGLRIPFGPQRLP